MMSATLRSASAALPAKTLNPTASARRTAQLIRAPVRPRRERPEHRDRGRRSQRPLDTLIVPEEHMSIATGRASIHVSRHPKPVRVIPNILIIAEPPGGANRNRLVREGASPQHAKRAVA